MLFTYGYIFYIPINFLFCLSILYYGRKNKSSYPFYCFAILFAIYMNFAIDKAFFPIIVEDIKVWGNVRNYMDLSLNFSEMGGTYQIVGNILLTVPLGIILPFITNLNNKSRIVVIAVISCMIEIIQWIIIFTFHTITLYFDIKDMVLNLAGGIAGFIVFLFIGRIALRIFDNRRSNKMIDFVCKVCKNTTENRKSFYGL